MLVGNPGGVRSGYINIDPFVEANNQGGRVKCLLHDLRELVEANEAQEIVANNVLDCYSDDMADKVLEHWLSRLAHQGELAVSVTDLNSVCRAYLGGKLTLEEANALLHRSGSKLSSLTMDRLREALEKRGMEVTSARIEGHNAVVRCRRP